MLQLKKSQSSFEAASLIAAMILVMSVLFSLLSGRLFEEQERRDKELVEDLAEVIESELHLAYSAEDGYSKVFFIPSMLGSHGISIEFFGYDKVNAQHSEIVVKYANYLEGFERVVFASKDLNGSICTGNNRLDKKGGFVSVSCV